MTASYVSDTTFYTRGLCLKRVKVNMHMTMVPVPEVNPSEGLRGRVESETVIETKRVVAIGLTSLNDDVILWPEALAKLCHSLSKLHAEINTRIARNGRGHVNHTFHKWEIQVNEKYRILLLGVEQNLLLGATLAVLKWSPEARQYTFKGEVLDDKEIAHREENFMCLKDLDVFTEFVTMSHYYDPK